MTTETFCDEKGLFRRPELTWKSANGSFNELHCVCLDVSVCVCLCVFLCIFCLCIFLCSVFSANLFVLVFRVFVCISIDWSEVVLVGVPSSVLQCAPTQCSSLAQCWSVLQCVPHSVEVWRSVSLTWQTLPPASRHTPDHRIGIMIRIKDGAKIRRWSLSGFLKLLCITIQLVPPHTK